MKKLIYDGTNPHNSARGINFVDFGSVSMDDGSLIDLRQSAYIQQAGAPAECWYEAHGIDRTTGAEYMVTWQITNVETEDESQACDWDNFEVRSL